MSAQIPLTGSVGPTGPFAILGFSLPVITGNADHVLTEPEYSSMALKVTSDGASTAIRNVIAPLAQGMTFLVENATSEGFAIVLKGATGTGVTIPSGQSTFVTSPDGANYANPKIVPAAPLLSPGVQSLADAGAGVFEATTTLIAIPYTPQSSGRVRFGLSYIGNASALDFFAIAVLVYAGAAASGGTVVNGIRYYQGGSPTITVSGGTFELEAAIANGLATVAISTLPAGQQFAGGVTVVGEAQLSPGTAYLFQFEIGGQNAGVAYKSQFVNVYLEEVS